MGGKRLRSDSELNKYKPKRELEIFAHALISQDVKGNELAAERLTKISRHKFRWAMQTSRDFRLWYSDLCFSILAKNEAIPPYALLGAILDKDVQAIRTYYELTGRLNNKIEHSGRIEGERNIIIIRNENKTEALAGQVSVLESTISSNDVGLGNRQVDVAHIAGNDVQRDDTK